MPIFEYIAIDPEKACDYCRNGFEYLHLKSDELILEHCPECGRNLEKLLSNCSFRLKGDGWYAPSKPDKDEKKKLSDDDDKKSSSGRSACSTCSGGKCSTC